MAKKSPTLGVDFILRTIMDRESTGKRKIRPKTVEDVLLPEDTDDSDYEYVGEDADLEDESIEEEEHSSKSGSSNSSGDDNSESDDGLELSEPEHSDSGSNTESDNEKQKTSSKKSALRDTIKKLDDSPNFRKPKKKRKRPPVKSKVNSSTTMKSSNVNSSTNEVSKSKPGGTGVVQNGPSTATPNKRTSRKKKATRGSKSRNADGEQASKSRKSKSLRKREKKSKKHPPLSTLLTSLDSLQAEARKEIDLQHLICWFCLGDKNDETNEIIECDSCGITVHEACYGVSDGVSVSSGTESSNSTEPWFCDACKSGQRNIICELCPAEGGLFKETTTGRWVHLICAMYIPGITVSDDGTPNMLELSYSNWGYYLCSACENERDARIGITIRCDAGLCKTYVHATCAHRAGLLSDPTAAYSGDVADPYYAACRMHSNRELTRRRAESYKMLREQIRLRMERKKSTVLTDLEKTEQTRIKSKIEKIRSKIAAKFLRNNPESANFSIGSAVLPSTSKPYAEVPPLWKSTKKSRMLHTTPLVDKFLSKASIIGHDVKSLELEEKHERIATNVKRKWNVHPALNVEYAAYYADRELRLATLTDQCEKLEKDKKFLIDQHVGTKSALEDMTDEHAHEVELKEKLVQDTKSLKDILTLLSPANQLINNIVVPKRRHSSSVGRKSPIAAKRDRRSPSTKRSKAKPKSSPVNGSQSPTGRLRIVKCNVCGGSDDQHLITRCDKCKKNYHLGCLDPPLTRMPKKSRTFGWMCSDCGDESEESDAPDVDTEAPRTLRGREKLQKPNKYRSGGGSPNGNNHVVGGKKKKGGGGGGTKSRNSVKAKEPSTPWVPPKNTSVSSIQSDSPTNSFSEGRCSGCSREDFKKNLVMCDKCYLEFHFLCLTPPLKYSPKRRGYSWFCSNCDEASSVDSHHSLKLDIDPMGELSLI